MNVRALTIASTAMLVAMGCDSIPFIGGSDQAATDSAAVDSTAVAAPEQAGVAALDSPPVAAVDSPPPAPQPQQATTAPAPQPRQAPVQAEGEIPWSPTRTGTVSPGMSSAQVIETWGEPVAQRSHGNHMFMYFRNGCERSCGTFDLVILEGDQVVDAVVRGFGHTYSGVSSSPASVNAVPTPPTDSTGAIG